MNAHACTFPFNNRFRSICVMILVQIELQCLHVYPETICEPEAGVSSRL